jgi:hypothetical protein
MLALDPDPDSTEALRLSIYHMYDAKGERIADNDLAVLESMALIQCKNKEQLDTIPGGAAWNCLFISLHFPDCFAVAQRFYRENPFCYQVFIDASRSYTKEELSCIMHSRPVGLLESVGDPQEVREMLWFIWHISDIKTGVLRLSSRKRYCTVPLDSIVYIKSDGHKCYFYTAIYANSVSCTEDDIFVYPAKSEKDIFAYVQSAKLSEIEKMLPPDFKRVHQSFIVNTKYIWIVDTEKGNYAITLRKNGITTEIPISVKYKEDVKNWANDFQTQ